MEWTDSFVAEKEQLRRDVTAANDETGEALQALADYKETVTSLEHELNAAGDVEKMHNKQVTNCIRLIAFHQSLSLITEFYFALAAG